MGINGATGDMVATGYGEEGADETLVPGDVLILPGVREAIASGAGEIDGFIWHAASGAVAKHTFALGALTAEERKILLAGCLVNHYREDE